MMAGLSPLTVMIGGVVAVVEAEFCVTDTGGFEPPEGLG